MLTYHIPCYATTALLWGQRKVTKTQRVENKTAAAITCSHVPRHMSKTASDDTKVMWHVLL